MKKLIMFGLGFLLTIGSAFSAQALTIDSVGGIFSNPTGGKNIRYNNDSSKIRWGIGNTGRSGLGFVNSAPLNFDADDIFSLGTLTHYNKPIEAGSAISGVDFELSLAFSDPAGFNYTADLSFLIDETPNNATPNSNPKNDDFITFSNTSTATMFNLGGVEYTFTLMGFGDTATTLSDTFRSSEGGANSTELWATVTASPSEVPEPATMLLFGAGMAGLAGLRNRKK